MEGEKDSFSATPGKRERGRGASQPCTGGGRRRGRKRLVCWCVLLLLVSSSFWARLPRMILSISAALLAVVAAFMALPLSPALSSSNMPVLLVFPCASCIEHKEARYHLVSSSLIQCSMLAPSPSAPSSTRTQARAQRVALTLTCSVSCSKESNS